MPRFAAKHHHQHHRLIRRVAVTALFALASSPSAAFVSGGPSVTAGLAPGSALIRGGSRAFHKRKQAKGLTMSTTTTDADTTDAVTMTPASKLEALRSKMKELNLDVYLVPSDDPHLSGK